MDLLSLATTNEKKKKIPVYQGFSVMANENGHWIWILHVKIH